MKVMTKAQCCCVQEVCAWCRTKFYFEQNDDDKKKRMKMVVIFSSPSTLPFWSFRLMTAFSIIKR